MATALLSLARGRRSARVAAMSGELTLTGRVLPAGGIREKLLAAQRNRVTDIILPEANRRDFEELPAHVYEGLKLHFVKHYLEVPMLVFGT